MDLAHEGVVADREGGGCYAQKFAWRFALAGSGASELGDGEDKGDKGEQKEVLGWREHDYW